MNWCNDKLHINLKKGTVVIENDDGSTRELAIQSRDGFQVMADLWLRAGWDNKYVYSFSWMGRPVIQLPDDMMRIQEVIYDIRPDVIIETGIAHGGSLIYYASLIKMMGYEGKVVGVDIEIRPHNRSAIESHELYSYLTMIEGSSIDPNIVSQVEKTIGPDQSTLVLLDSNHSYEHVLEELKQYGPLVSTGSYIVVTDGIMKDLQGAPRSEDDWASNNPYQAAQEFLAIDDRFELVYPDWPFNESDTIDNTSCVSYWPGAWLKRVR